MKSTIPTMEYVLLGDSGYALRSYLMTPYLNPVLPWQRRFNRAHKKTRCLVERVIGIWKRQFHVLHSKIRKAQKMSEADVNS